MSDRRSFSARLLDELDELRSSVDDLVRRSAIHNVDPNSPGSGVVFIGAAKWGWVRDESMLGERTRLLARFEDWVALFRLIQRDALASTARRIDPPVDRIRRWIEADGGDINLPATIDGAAKMADDAFDELSALVKLATHGSHRVIAIPDTNCLLRQPDVAQYGEAIGTDGYTVVMLTTVVAELDELKDRGRTDDVRAAANKAVRRLKGLRDRGNIREGVRVEGQVDLRMEHREVQVSEIFDWLDPDVPDDRILGGALELQARHPAATVVIVTTDLNLQNKAAAVGLPFTDISN